MGKNRPEVKTEEGFSADIYPWRYMSAQCPHYVPRTASRKGYMSLSYFLREMLCGHCTDIYLQGYMSALYPSTVLSSCFFKLFGSC